MSDLNSSRYRVRRATLDDLNALMGLWHSMQFPADALARRVTEFQVAEDASGQVLGGVGLQVAERQGLIHSEAFADFALAETLRPLLWDRLQNIANNQGLLRLWTTDQAPFWTRNGMALPDSELLAKLPAVWREHGSFWLVLKLREPVEELLSADQEFALFMQTEKQRTARTLQHARLLKIVATLIALSVLLFIAIVGGSFIARNYPHLRSR